VLSQRRFVSLQQCYIAKPNALKTTHATAFAKMR